MMTRLRAGTLIAGCAIVLAACASTDSASTPPVSTHPESGTQSTRPSPMSAQGATMSPGMVMPDGTIMGARAPGQDAGPSDAARMICSAEVRTDITTVLGLTSVPKPSSRWANHVYTCTYRLPMGTFVLSVTESKDAAAAQSFAAKLRSGLRHPSSTAGLTTTAFSTPQGLVALVKDNDTLQVDASRLPAQFGAQQEKRTDFAYEIASDILGCWTNG